MPMALVIDVIDHGLLNITIQSMCHAAWEAQTTAEMLASPSPRDIHRCPFFSCGLETVASTRNLGAKPRSNRFPIALLSSATEKVGMRSALKAAIGEPPVDADNGTHGYDNHRPGLRDLGGCDRENHHDAAQQP